MLQLALRQVVSRSIDGVKHFFALIARVVQVHVPPRRVPGLVGIEGVHVQEEALATVFLKPLSRVAHRLRREAVLLALAGRDVAQVLDDQSIRAAQLDWGSGKLDLSGLGRELVVFLAAYPVEGVKATLEVGTMLEGMWCVANHHGHIPGGAKHFLEHGRMGWQR